MNYVAFLRGINVGGRVVKMVDLKLCFDNLKFENVVTVLQSGNVIFEAGQDESKLKPIIEAALAKTFNYPAKVQVINLEKLQVIIKDYPFGLAGPAQHDYVIFLEDGLERELVKESYELAVGEKVKAGDGLVYWRVDKGSTLKSNFAKLLTKARYKDFNTNRNLNTLRKIIHAAV